MATHKNGDKHSLGAKSITSLWYAKRTRRLMMLQGSYSSIPKAIDKMC